MLYTQVHRLALWFLRERGGDTFRISPRGGVGEGQEPRVTVAGRDIHDRLSRDWKVAGAYGEANILEISVHAPQRCLAEGALLNAT